MNLAGGSGGRLFVAVAFALSAGAAAAQVVDPWFPDTDRPVSATLLMGDTLYVGGSFTRIGGTRTGGFVPIDMATGQPGEGWPRVDGTVYACAADDRGGWYIGGNFSSVAGVPRQCLAHLRADRSLDDWDPAVSGGSTPSVRAIVVNGGTVYVGGSFTTVGGQARANLAALYAANGQATAWNPGASGASNLVTALLFRSGVLYVGGSFSTLGGATRGGLGAVDVSLGTATAWTPSVVGTVYVLASSGSTLYVGGSFNSAGGQPRTALASYDFTSGQLNAWSPAFAHALVTPSVGALAVLGTTVYAGGVFSSAGGQPRSGAVALDATTGLATAWNPSAQGGQYPSVQTLAIRDTLVYAGGTFTTIGGSARGYVAALGLASGVATAWDPAASAGVYCLAATNRGLFAGGAFSCLGGVLRSGLAAIDVATSRVTTWNPGVSGTVAHLASNGVRIFACGAFTAVGGQPRNGFAAIDPRSAAVFAWDPHAGGGAVPNVYEMIARDSTVYIGGIFASIGGQPRVGLAALDAVTGAVRAWNANLDPAGYVRDLALCGQTLYFCGSFSSVGAVGRFRVAAVDALTALPTSWAPNPIGSFLSLESVEVSGTTVYVGGRYSSMNGYGRSGISAFDSATGELTDWNPGAFHSAYPNVYKIWVHGSDVYLGGVFEWLAGVPRNGFGVVDAVTGMAKDWNPQVGGTPGDLACGDGVLYSSGGLAGPTGLRVSGLAATATTVPAPPSVQLLTPYDGRTFIVASTIHLTWNASAGQPGGVQSVDLCLSRTGPNGPWEVIAAGAPNTGAYDWKLTGPEVVGDAYLRVLVRDYAGQTTSDQGSGPFSILNWATDASATVTPEWALGAPAPNPMRADGRVALHLPAPSHVRLSLFDVQGREVAVLARGLHETGTHQIPIATSGLRPGLYFVTLASGGRSLSRRVLVVR